MVSLKRQFTSFYPLRSRAHHNFKENVSKKRGILPQKTKVTDPSPKIILASITALIVRSSRPSPRIPRPLSSQVDRLASWPPCKHPRPLSWPVPGP